MIKLNFYSFRDFSPQRNMEIDNFFLREDKGFVFRLYGWKPPAVSIGVSQIPEKVCNVDYCKQSEIPIVKRITGGGAVYHKNDITYMFSAPLDFFEEKTVLGVYKKIGEIFLQVFKKIGIECTFAGNVSRDARKRGMQNGVACFLLPSDYEITVGGKKIIGNALRIEKGRIMQHGSIAFDFDYEETAKVLNTDAARLRERVCCIKDFNKDISVEEFEKICRETLNENGFNICCEKQPFLFEK